MPKYVFTAKALNGSQVRGEIDASNEQDVRNKLRAQRVIPLRIVPKQAKPVTGSIMFGAASIKPKDLQVFTRQLATLLAAGIPIVDSLTVLGQGRKSTLTNAVNGVISSLTSGKPLAEALREYPGVFDKFYCNMVAAAEKSGNLDTVLNRLAVYIEKSVKLQGKIKGALLYPAIILIVASGVITVILVFVIPKFKTLFDGAGKKLPALTEMVIQASNFLQAKWWLLLIIIAGAIFGISSYYKTEPGRQQMDALLIDVPIFGALIQKGGIAKLTRTMATLLSSGVGIIETLEIGARIVGNASLEKVVVRAKDSISEGKTIAFQLQKERLIPAMVAQMIGVGEQTGNLDQMLAKIADFYEDEVDVAVASLTSIIEPLMMVVLGVIIAVLVTAMYLPIFNLAGAITGT